MGSPFQVADCLFDVALVLVLGQLQEQALFRRSRIPRVKDLLSQGLSPPESGRAPARLSQPSLQAEPPSPWAWPVSPALEPASVVCLRARVLIHGPLEQNQDLVVEVGLGGGGAAAPAAAASAAPAAAAFAAPAAAAATARRAGLPPPPRGLLGPSRAPSVSRASRSKFLLVWKQADFFAIAEAGVE